MSSALAPFAVATLEREHSTVYALTDELRISWVNPAWSAFARSNRAAWSNDEWGPGRAVLDATPAVLRPFYQSLYTAALTKREVMTHEYDCSSPQEHRRFQMRIHPCETGGLVVIHSLLRAGLHEWHPGSGLDSLYRRPDGLIAQCSHCRRVRRADEPATWEWVPRLIEKPAPMTSHGLCSVCSAFYYPRVVRAGAGGVTVLVVDDDNALRNVAARILRRQGHEVLEARDGAAALALFRSGQRADVVVTDVVMGQLDGVALAAELQAMQPELAVVLMSGANVERAADVPGALVLPKPFTVSSLTEILDRALRGVG